MSGQEEPRVERSQHERPVTLKRNQICNQHSRKTAGFISRTIKFQNAAGPFSGIYAQRAGISPLIFDGRSSSTPPLFGEFSETTVAKRVRNLESRGGVTRKGG
jgi:hypothetical protein